MNDHGSIVVRRAVAADRTEMGRLGAALIEAHHAFDPTRFVGASGRTADLYAAYLDRQREQADALVLVAENAGIVIGYCFAANEGADPMTLRGPAGVVHDLFVDHAYRRSGVARRLLEDVRARLFKMGAPRLMLSTAARNLPAQRLFASMGFRPTMIEMTADFCDLP